MARLPTGTVTFVFTDIEGSTRLLHTLGTRYRDALEHHRALLRAAFASHGGVEVDTQGDAFFVAFPTPHGAVLAAIQAQRALRQHPWADGAELRVRMGIHTGTPEVTDEGYVGADVHLGARICAAAWGGQILVSSATANLVSSGLRDVTLRPLGAHALKDIDERVELFQVLAPALTSDFPPPRTTGSHPTNLPARLPPLIGRDDDLFALTETLSTDDVALVTLTGPGGTGKTRLALAAGAELLASFADGVFFVDLSALTDPSLVVPAIAQTLSLRESPGRSLQATLTDHLAHKEILVVLDNLEQVIDAAEAIASLLTSAPGLKVLATSRAPLRVAGEKELPVAPLSLPHSSDPPEDVVASPAVRLFLARARDVVPGFTLTPADAALVAEVCRRLDGLPLAIELAAARVKVLSLAALNERLAHGLKVLTSGRRDASDRQRTLKGAISWSYDLLTQQEQRLFRRLGVFAGGWTLEAVEAVCDRGDLDTDVLDGLASLVDNSLVRTDKDRERFSMLETIREFAFQMLEESGEAEDTRRGHAEFFRTLAEEAEPHTVQGSKQVYWLDVLERDHDNLRTALLHFSSVGDQHGYRQLTVALASFWRLHSHLTEGRRWLQQAVSMGGTDSVLTRLLTSLGLMAFKRGDYEHARAFFERSLTVSEQLGLEDRMEANLNDLGMVSIALGDYERARALFERSLALARRKRDKLGVAYATHNLADLALNEGNYKAARALAVDSLGLWEEIGDTEGRAAALANAGLATIHLGDPAEATRLLTEALSAARALGSKETIAGCLDGFAWTAARAGELTRAVRFLIAAERLREEIGAEPERFERELHQATLALVRTELGDDGLARAISAERAAMCDKTITEAMRVGERTVAKCR